MKSNKKFTRLELAEKSKEALSERGVEVKDIAEIVLFLQVKYQKDLTLECCIETVESVLEKREVSYAILTGLELDKAAENGTLDEPLLSIIKSDDALYGLDEIIPLSIVNLYGSIGFTNFGYLDKLKPGIIGELDSVKNDTVNTFIDDLVCAVAAASATRIAHSSEE